MSLPKFDKQGSLFESLGPIASDLFDEKDKYELFAKRIWPLLAPKVAIRGPNHFMQAVSQASRR